ncbi:MAG TPA: amidohydrolase family protein [Gemmatimonadaceae bacterium]|nr:amidohydrolase family protein [Gemmatimonadaceae bacterium]
MVRRLLLAIPLALPAALSVAAAQANNPGGPPLARSDYALTNVRIVTAPGRVVERGTVVVRDGRIAAVGANVPVPAGVVRMDLTGHTVFPGLIDAATSIGLPSPTRQLPAAAEDAPAGGRGGRGAAPAQGGRGQALGRASTPAPPVVLPELEADAEAADMFTPTEAELKALRAGGVTTVGLVFQGGIFPGRVGAALTGSQSNSRLALRASAGQEVSFGTRRGGYPGTGIGSVAFIRQTFLDAQYEARVDKAFKAGTPGARPSNDPLRRALVPAATNTMPAWFVASTERQLIRVAEIAGEMELRNPVVVGTQEGWRAIPALKKMGATAVVSLDWPSPDDVTGRIFLAYGDGRPGTAPPVTAADTAEVRGNAAALAKAGVPVALASFGGESGTTFRDRVRATIAAGMSPDDALRAVTVTPAALLGITAAVGTIEVGKLANLVVVTGNDLFASGTPIKHVFVEGRLY